MIPPSPIPARQSGLTLLLGLLSCGLPPAAAWAGEPLTGAEAFSPGISLLKAIGALILIIGLLLFVAAALRKTGLHQGLGGPGELIKVIETRSLGPRKYLAVVETAGEFFLVGVSDQQINLLTTLSNQDLLRQGRSDADQARVQAGSGFAGVLSNLIKPRPPKD